MSDDGSNGNGRATIREVHALLTETRGEVLAAVEKVSDKLDEKVTRLEGRVTKLWIALGSVSGAFALAGMVLRLLGS